MSINKNFIIEQYIHFFTTSIKFILLILFRNLPEDGNIYFYLFIQKSSSQQVLSRPTPKQQLQTIQLFSSLYKHEHSFPEFSSRPL